MCRRPSRREEIARLFATPRTIRPASVPGVIFVGRDRASLPDRRDMSLEGSVGRAAGSVTVPLIAGANAPDVADIVESAARMLWNQSSGEIAWPSNRPRRT